MDQIGYEFASTGGGVETGFSDPLSTAFKGNIAYFLARESLQNIIDARVPDSDNPALATYTMIHIPAQNLPDSKELLKRFKACRDYYKDNSESVRFFEMAIEKMEKNHNISILKISDCNTTGLTGDEDDQNGNCYSFLKAVGSSAKSGGKGGSFGLGKGAYFQASRFKTIFVSSYYSGNYVFQGKLRLVTHLWNGDKKNGDGSYGMPQQRILKDPALIPTLFLRKEQGTDIYVVDFEENGEWKENIVKSVINNFWCSILNGCLEVNVDGMNINKENLEEYMNMFYASDKPASKEESNPMPYYKTYTQSRCITQTLPTLGSVKLFIFQSANYPKRVAYIRKTGMIIQLKRYDFIAGYAGVFICEDQKGNEILRKMENEQHNEWNRENAKGTVYEKTATKVEREIRDFIRGELKKLRPDDNIKSLNIPGLEKYLFLKGEDVSGDSSAINNGQVDTAISKTESGVETGSVGASTTIHPNYQKIEVNNPSIGTGTKGDKFPMLEGGNGKKRGGSGGGPGDGDHKLIVLTQVKYRTFAIKQSDKSIQHVLLIKGPPNKDCEVELRAGTDDAYDEVEILHAEDFNGKTYQTKNNRISNVQLDDNGNQKIKLVFNSNQKYSLNMIAYENK